MGTDNLDIVVNELDALVNIDLSKRCIKSTHQSLNWYVWEPAALCRNIDIHTPIASRYGFGLDGLCTTIVWSISDEVLVDTFVAHCGWDCQASTSLCRRLCYGFAGSPGSRLFARHHLDGNGFLRPPKSCAAFAPGRGRFYRDITGISVPTSLFHQFGNGDLRPLRPEPLIGTPSPEHLHSHCQPRNGKIQPRLS